MPKHLNPTHMNSDLAAALGRFTEACVHLERRIEAALFRLLPVTDNIGRVLLSGNQMRRNLEILKALTFLPDVPLPDEKRDAIREVCLRCEAINQDRSRLLHNPIIDGENGYVLIQHKQDGKGSAAMPVSATLLRDRAEEAARLTYGLMMHVPSLDYDLSQWAKAFPSYPVKDYPTGQQPSQPPHSPRKRNDPKK